MANKAIEAVYQWDSVVGDKLLLYSNTHGIGVETNAITQWAPTTFRWRIGGTTVSGGTQYMTLTSSGLSVTGSVTASNLTAGRVAYVGTAGLIQDNSTFTFDGTTVVTPAFRSRVGADLNLQVRSNSGLELLGINDALSAYVTLKINGGLVVSTTGTITTPNVTASNLTSGRIAIVGASGLVTDNANLTFNTGTQTVSTTSLTLSSLLTTTAVTLSGFTSNRILYVGAAGAVAQHASLNYDSTTGTMSTSTVAASTAVTTPSLTVSGMTAGRVSFTTTAGLQTDNSLFTYSTTAGLGALRANFLNGEVSGSATISQISFGYNGSLQYPHFIMTQHNAGAATSNRIRFYTSDGTLAGVFPTNAVLGLTIENGRATAPQVAASNLTSGRVTFATTSGQLTDASGLTWDGTSLYSTSFISTGSGAGYQFSGRDAGPAGVWYATGGYARLFYNSADRLTVGSDGTTAVTGPFFSYDNAMFTVALPTTVSNAADICTVVNANFSAAVEVAMTVHLTGYAQTKYYLIPLAYDGTLNVWQLATPFTNSGPYAGNDCELDVRISASTATLRVRRTAGSTAGNAQISVRIVGDRSAYAGGATGTQLAASATTYTSQTVSVNYLPTALSVTSAGVVAVIDGFTTGGTATIGSSSGGTYNGNVQIVKADQSPYIAFRSGATAKVLLGADVNAGTLAIDAPGGTAIRSAVGGGTIWGRFAPTTGALLWGASNGAPTDDSYSVGYFNGALRAATVISGVTTVTSAVTLGTAHTVLADPTTAAFTIGLPGVASVPIGKQYIIKKVGATNNAVTIDASASETIDGALTVVLRDRNEVCTLVNNGTEWKRLDYETGNCPIGTVVAWHKSFTNTPALPTGWVECNGQTLSDAGSVYGGGAQVIPNLNGNTGTQKYFIRGSTTSGTTGGADSHSHNALTYSTSSACTGSMTVVTSISNTNTVNNIPVYMEFVLIMRVK